MIVISIDLTGKDGTFISNAYRAHSGLLTLELYRERPSRLASTDQAKEKIDGLQLAFEGGTTGNRVHIAQRKKLRQEVTEMFRRIICFLQSVATEDDIPALIQAGFRVRLVGGGRKKSAPAPAS